ncbi:MAG: hypothetical protein L3J39_12405, partial [Verrucomicrobiales bacterium]|nr:hypothetical protein [Verrucomicrobiales bacterium]
MIKVVKVAAYTWSNVFSEHPVLGVKIERVGEVPHVMGSELAAWQVKLAEMFVALAPSQVDANEAAWIDFLGALKLGRVLDLEVLIGGIAIGLQALEDGRVPRFFGFNPLSDSAQSVVFVAYHFRRTAVTAVLHATELVNMMLKHPRDWVQEIERWKKTFQVKSAAVGLDILLREMIEVAEVRGIPWRVMDVQAEMVVFGHGKKLIRYCGGLSDVDSALAQRIASNRIATFAVLNERQIALAPMMMVNSLEQIEPTLAKMAYPLLICSAVRGGKEREFHFFYREDEVLEKSKELLKTGSAVIFQRVSSAQAKIYHLLVVGGEFFMALSLGENGQMQEVAKVHPDNVRLVERASSLIGLKMAEVVLIAEDMSESWLRGAVKLFGVEYAFFSRKKWSDLQRSKVATAMLAFLFPGDQNGRIPIAAITGTNGKTTTCLMLDHILRTAGRSSGVATTEGVRVAGRVNGFGDAAAGQGATAVLEDAVVEIAVLETARGGLLDEGMAFDSCEVSAVLNVTADHLGLGGIETLQQLAELKGRVARTARDLVVLNVDDPLT